MGGTGDAELLALVGELIGLLDLHEYREGLLEALLRAIPSKWASLNEVSPAGVRALVTPHLDAVWFERFAELAHENPIYQRWVRTRDGRAYRFRDVCSREELEATRLYREIYAPLGIHYQIAISLPEEGGGRMLAIVLHREDRDFSDAERDFLNRARPFIIQTYRNAIACAASPGERRLAAVLVEAGLTAREAEIVERVTAGRSNREIASDLGIAPRTVQKHLEHAFRKLGVDSRTAAAARAQELAERRGLDDVPTYPASDG